MDIILSASDGSYIHASAMWNWFHPANYKNFAWSSSFPFMPWLNLNFWCLFHMFSFSNRPSLSVLVYVAIWNMESEFVRCVPTHYLCSDSWPILFWYCRYTHLDYGKWYCRYTHLDYGKCDILSNLFLHIIYVLIAYVFSLE